MSEVLVARRGGNGLKIPTEIKATGADKDSETSVMGYNMLIVPGGSSGALVLFMNERMYAGTTSGGTPEIHSFGETDEIMVGDIIYKAASKTISTSGSRRTVFMLR